MNLTGYYFNVQYTFFSDIESNYINNIYKYNIYKLFWACKLAKFKTPLEERKQNSARTQGKYPNCKL